MFAREVPSQPVAIGSIRLVLYDPDPNDPNDSPPSVRAHIVVKMGDGRVRVREVDLGGILPANNKTYFRAVMVALRAKAEQEILPEATP